LQLGELRRAEQTRERMLRELVRLERRIDALATAAPDDAEQAAFDLWADDIETVGGSVVVTDAEGNAIADLVITQPDLERWLMDAGVEKRDAANEPSE
ncbi:MAG: hypothetical protein AAF747_01450, partial [Planctomycetota bacterium]